MDKNKEICRRVYFWDFQETSNRCEFYLILHDKRLRDMYKDGIIVLLIHSTVPRGLFKKSVRTIELQKSRKEGIARLMELNATIEADSDVEQFIVKPAPNERFNLALYPTSNSLILHRFKKEQPLPKFAFDKSIDAERFLYELNEATVQFINKNSAMWYELNR